MFGLVRMCQLALPGMRRQRWGKIVNVSSMGGKLTFPGGGIYHGTKHAVEAISDALRFEVRDFGVDVIVIEPGLIRTQFADAAVNAIDERHDRERPVRGVQRSRRREPPRAHTTDRFAKLGGGPEDVAHKIEKAISRRRPKARYPVTPSARMILGIHAVLPDRGWDAFAGTNFPRPKP